MIQRASRSVVDLPTQTGMSSLRLVHTKVAYHLGMLNGLCRAAGPVAALRWGLLAMRKKFSAHEPATWRVRPRRVSHSVAVRLCGSSDMRVLQQIFVSEEYSCLRDIQDVKLVLDLGANIGLSSAYFLGCFPNSRVVAVEPDEQNLILCKANLLPYGDRALVLNGAVWSRSMKLRLSRHTFGDGREWATEVYEPNEEDAPAADVQAWDVPTLIHMAGGGTVDLLKVDIERAERSVFGPSGRAWLPTVRNICIELHGKDCEETFFSSLRDFEYDLEHSGELTICRNLRLKTRV